MRKLSIIFLLILFGCDEADNCVNGNNNYIQREFTPGYFENVKNPFPGTLILKAGDPKVIVNAESNLMDLLDIRLDGSTLALGTKNGDCFSSHGIDFEIYSDSFRELTNNGSADWTSDFLEFDPVITSNGSGDITLTGQSVTQRIELSGSGDVNLASMPADTAYIKNNASGHAGVQAGEHADVIINGSGSVTVDSLYGELHVVINGSGNLYYSGDPSKEVIKLNGSGQVVKK